MSKSIKNHLKALEGLRMVEQYRDVLFDEIHKDTSYQRDELPIIKRIVRDFDSSAVGTLLLGEREDKSLWITDGLQRMTALKLKGYTKWKCSIFKSEGPAHEASVFVKANNRTKVHSLVLFRARVASGEEIAKAITAMVEAVGFRVPPNSLSRTNTPESLSRSLMCIDAVELAYTHSPMTLQFICKILSSVWKDDGKRTAVQFIEGLHHFWKKHNGIVDAEKLIDRMNTETAITLLGWAQQAMGWKRGDKMAEVLERVYNKRIKKAK